MASNQQEMFSVKNAIERTVHAYFTVHAKTESQTKLQDVVEDVRKYVAALYVSGQIAPDFTVSASSKAIDVQFTFNGQLSRTSYLVPIGFSKGKTFVEAVKAAEKTPSNQAELEQMWATRKAASDIRLVEEIKGKLQTIAESYLFEPNDSTTRASLHDSMCVYLKGQFIDDYTVVCDETNNTPYRIDCNELWADVAIKLHGEATTFMYIPVRIFATPVVQDRTDECGGEPVTVQVVPSLYATPCSPHSKVSYNPVSALAGMAPVGYNAPISHEPWTGHHTESVNTSATFGTLEGAEPRRVFTVDVGDMPNDKVMSYLEKVKAETNASRAARAFDAAKVD